jgi:hypothetical protein
MSIMEGVLGLLVVLYLLPRTLAVYIVSSYTVCIICERLGFVPVSLLQYEAGD